jgi:hypothetical protein
MHSNGYTSGDIAQLLHITERSVRKRQGIEQYILGTMSVGRGRPVTVYSSGVLDLWGRLPDDLQTTTERKRSQRSDWGTPRNCTPEQWAGVILAVREFYMGNAQANLRLACEQAERQAAAAGVRLPISAPQIYKRLTCRNTAPDGLPISEFYRDNWEMIRRSGLRKKDISLQTVTARYDWHSVFESLGWAGAGYGALRGWSIDVRKNDVWTRDADGRGEFGAAIYIRCVLTGYPLWVEPVETETSEALIRAYLKCMFAWQRSPDLFVAIDNGRAMIAERTLGVIASTLPAEAFKRAANIPELFGAGASPILRNLPNIPRAPFKAALERSFKIIKDEHDATRHARNYQGGSRAEAVQLSVSNRPAWQYMQTNLVTVDEYFDGLGSWLYSDYITRERPDMHPLFRERGVSCSIGNVFRYYYDPTPSLPTGEQLADLLYWATDPRSRAIAKAGLGYVDVTINGTYWHCISDKLDHQYHQHKIAVLPIPDTDYAILMLADNPSDPRYIATARNGFIRSLDALKAVRPLVVETQNVIREKLKEEREMSPPARWENTAPVAEDLAPTLPQGAQAWIDGTELTIHALDEAPDTTIDSVIRDLDDIID